mgnify:FL=1
MTKEELKEGLLEGMCRFAEDIYNWEKYGRVYNIDFIGDRPLPFKPTISDKMLFNKMINEVIDNVFSEVNEKGTYTCEEVIGVSIMSRYYYPYYSWCDELELKKAKNNTNL